ncbi:hypothetical protein TNCV_4808931 [Trichonephila clavipes]|nr:hypothetical protein TNCV_4808931 [Trichonephila clavipes]
MNKKDRYLNSLPRQGEAGGRERPNEDETGETSRGREGKSAGREGLTVPKRVRGAPRTQERGKLLPNREIPNAILPQNLSEESLLEEGRVAVYRASTPQVLGSINGLGKVDSTFHPRYIGSINEYQACLGSRASYGLLCH